MAEQLFDAEDMAELIALDESAMPDVCDIIGAGTSSGGIDDNGAPTAAGGTTISGVICRYDDGLTGANEAVRAMRLTGLASAVLHIPLGIPVSEDDRVSYRGTTYEIVGTSAGQSYETSLALALRVAK